MSSRPGSVHERRGARARSAGGTIRTRSLLLVLLGLGAGCAIPDEDAPNIVLIVVDTLGAKHLGCYGAETRTPNIDDLARSGVRFNAAYAPAPWTMPSVATLLTGFMPSRHGVRTLNTMLDERELTLAEVLTKAGYSARAVVSHSLINAKRGFAQGFDAYDESAVSGHEGITSEKVTDLALQELEEMRSKRRPFLLFVHYFDPHYLYHHHPDFAHTGRYDGPVESGMGIWRLRDERAALSEADIEHLRGLYREEIAYTDHHLGRLLTAVRETGAGRPTLVVLTSDHGEELMEHGWIGHTRNLYDDLLRVPLIVSLPGVVVPRVVSSPVSLVDVVPTVADLAGVAGRSDWEGISLGQALRRGAEPPRDRTIFAEVSFGNRDASAREGDPRIRAKAAHMTAVVLGDLKLIHDEREGRYEMYDLEFDPGETDDLWKPVYTDGHPLLERLSAWEASRSNRDRSPEGRFTPEEMEELRALGYLR